MALDPEDPPGALWEANRSRSSLATSVNNNNNNNNKSTSPPTARVVFLNEQVSHHPPISCFWYEARSTLDTPSSKPLVIAHGVDQISAKFTGTSVKVFPGPMNKGIFLKLPNRNEEYEVGHLVLSLVKKDAQVWLI
jgi:pterin-4a-carbinolamine dehydratase